MEFEWDEEKNRADRKKHGIDFLEAETVFEDPAAGTMYDGEHSTSEDRYFTLGMSDKGRLLVVSHTERGDRIRILSARRPNRAERRRYEEG